MPDLDKLLREAYATDDPLPGPDATWRAGRRRAMAKLTAVAAGALAVVVGVVLVLPPGGGPLPEIAGEPTADVEPTSSPSATGPADDSSSDAPPTGTPVPSPSASGGSDGDPTGRTDVTWAADDVVVATTPTSLTGLVSGREVELPAEAAVAYPQQLWVLADGAIAWQAASGPATFPQPAGVWVLPPDEVGPVLVLDQPGNGTLLELTGVGDLESPPVLFVTARGTPVNIEDTDVLGQRWSVSIDGTVDVLGDFQPTEATERTLAGASGWTLVERDTEGGERTVTIVDPDGRSTALPDGGETPAEWTLQPADEQPLLVSLSDVGDDWMLAARPADELDSADAVWDVLLDVPDGTIPKAIAATGAAVSLTLLPDDPTTIVVDSRGEQRQFDTAGVAAVIGSP